MRVCVVVALFFLGCAWAQQKELVSAPLPNHSTNVSSVYQFL